ncbi:MAG: ornithine cyclodeaminase family protein, partial [Chloroflexi bacterium]|nr:ornithine cyclodeaminase family protein [Chloroflexota bacterium]
AMRGHDAKFYVQLSSTETGEMLALIEAFALGQIRTGAASGVATRYMAREDSTTVGVIGVGKQAGTQLEAVCRVRDIRLVKVFSRTPERRESFAAEMGQQLGISVVATADAEACVNGSDVVIIITNSSTPVISGEWLSAGAHVNAAGANSWMRRELDDEAVRRSNVIVADDVEQAKIECGDLIYPIEQGIIRWEQVRSLSEVVAGRAPGRVNADDITLFESQGIALEDIAVGARIYELAKANGVGRELPF